MMKKIVKAFSFFALLQIIIYSCCEEAYNVYYKTAEFTIIDVEDYDNTTVASEDLVLQLNFSYNYVNVSQVIDLNQLSNTAYATTCDEDYFYKDTVTNIVITASETIFDIEAGNAINDKLLFINPNTLESESLDNLIAFLNNSNGYAFNPLDIVLNELLPSDLTLSFSITIDLAGGRSLESTTDLTIIE